MSEQSSRLPYKLMPGPVSCLSVARPGLPSRVCPVSPQVRVPLTCVSRCPLQCPPNAHDRVEMDRDQPALIGELCRAVEQEYDCWEQFAAFVRQQLAGRLECLERPTTPLVLWWLPKAGLFPLLRSPLFFLSHPPPSGKVAHRVCCQLAVLTVSRPRQGLHDPFTVLHHLALNTRGLGLSCAPVQLCSVGRVIHEMPNRPPFVGGAMQAAGGGRLNALLTKDLRKAFSPTNVALEAIRGGKRVHGLPRNRGAIRPRWGRGRRTCTNRRQTSSTRSAVRNRLTRRRVWSGSLPRSGGSRWKGIDSKKSGLGL